MVFHSNKKNRLQCVLALLKKFTPYVNLFLDKSRYFKQTN